MAASQISSSFFFPPDIPHDPLEGSTARPMFHWGWLTYARCNVEAWSRTCRQHTDCHASRKQSYCTRWHPQMGRGRSQEAMASGHYIPGLARRLCNLRCNLGVVIGCSFTSPPYMFFLLTTYNVSTMRRNPTPTTTKNTIPIVTKTMTKPKVTPVFILFVYVRRVLGFLSTQASRPTDNFFVIYI